MSGLYNMLFGENASQKDFLLGLLGKTTGDFGRYRDVYVTDEYIVVHTRNGGGNREDYEGYLEDDDHPLYSHNEDCDYDSTYADIFYKHPEGYGEVLKEMAAGTITPSEKWEALFAALGSSK